MCKQAILALKYSQLRKKRFKLNRDTIVSCYGIFITRKDRCRTLNITGEKCNENVINAFNERIASAGEGITMIISPGCLNLNKEARCRET